MFILNSAKRYQHQQIDTISNSFNILYVGLPTSEYELYN